MNCSGTLGRIDNKSLPELTKPGDFQDSPQKYWESVAFQENGIVFSLLNFDILVVVNYLEMRFKHRTIGVVYKLYLHEKSQRQHLPQMADVGCGFSCWSCG